MFMRLFYWCKDIFDVFGIINLFWSKAHFLNQFLIYLRYSGHLDDSKSQNPPPTSADLAETSSVKKSNENTTENSGHFCFSLIPKTHLKWHLWNIDESVYRFWKSIKSSRYLNNSSSPREDSLSKQLGVCVLDCHKPQIPLDEFYNEILSDALEMDVDFANFIKINEEVKINALLLDVYFIVECFWLLLYTENYIKISFCCIFMFIRLFWLFL